MAGIGKSHSSSKTELTSSTHLFTDNHHMETLNSPEGKDAAHPIDPKLFPDFSSSSYFCSKTAFTDQKLLDQLQNPLPHPPLPRSQSCKKSQAWAQSLEETWASHKVMQWEPKVVL